jgi:MFS family permease
METTASTDNQGATLPTREGDRTLRHERWNFAALSVEGTFFMLATGFVDSSTVLPVFVSTFTGSRLAIGAIAAASTGGWFLLQMLGAGLVQHRPRKKPFFLWAAFPARSVFLWFGLLLLFLGASRPELLLAGFFALLWLFYLGDGLNAVSYFDLTAKAIRPTNRGKLWGVMQLLGGPAAVGAGLAVRWALSDDGPSYPYNYALLFVAAGVALVISTTAISALREPPELDVEPRMSLRHHFSRIPRLLKENPLILRLVAVKLLAGFGDMALPFYIIFARERLGFPVATVGYFVATQMIGTVVFGMLCGYGCDRLGNRLMMRVALCAGAAVPAIAMLTALMRGHLGGAGIYIFILIFLLIGGVLAWSTRLVYLNLLMEVAPSEQRPTYVGLLNTLSAPVMFAPVIGGLIAGNTSYAALFAVTLIFPLIGLVVSLGVPEPRYRCNEKRFHDASPARDVS